ncbi:GH36-type glycosyl hydrolase domain-containing protein [Spirochaeta dissipatitropha]
MSEYVTSRRGSYSAESRIREIFGTSVRGYVDARCMDSHGFRVWGIAGLPFVAPVTEQLSRQSNFLAFVITQLQQGNNLLVDVSGGKKPVFKIERDGEIRGIESSVQALEAVSAVLAELESWAGTIESDGSHRIGLKSPLPGPHFGVNLLIGNRTGFPNVQQTTPKSVVGRLGRGSFRSHAATQVLATRWDLRQEENGFPANRQFYLTEGNRQIFYSADARTNVNEGFCRHGQNHTEICCLTECGIDIKRRIFILPHQQDLPLAVEVQGITLRNNSKITRNLRFVGIGMFGPSKPPALQEDVLYSTIIMESGMIRNADGSVMALSPWYHPDHDRRDRRFHTLLIHSDSGTVFPSEFTTDYGAFLGDGSLEEPSGLLSLDNRLTRRGPGFFALGSTVTLAPGEVRHLTQFTGLVSLMGDEGIKPYELSPRDGVSDSRLLEEISRLIETRGTPGAIHEALQEIEQTQENWASFFSISGGTEPFCTYVSRNLPFQLLYQSMVSRSFGQTQKGYREIGFREIQDLFASLPFFCASGQDTVVQQLILNWASHLHPFGYADHNFYWEGKESGEWSDDALWLHQAVGRYIRLTGDESILSMKVREKISLFQLLVNALRYSTEISIGVHGIPLLDRADWNDCLKLDQNYHSGPEKEKIREETGEYSSMGTESIMNGFLAVVAAKELEDMAGILHDEQGRQWARKQNTVMTENLRKHGCINGVYARLLFNSYPGFSYAGAEGDGLDTDGSGGTFFLNSFSWSVLSGVANEDEIGQMLTVIREKLKTPHGLKLVSPIDLGRVVPGTASGEYFPGDRENGGVFKHAVMMAATAFFHAARRVENFQLARELAKEAWEMIDLVLPPRTLNNPFVLGGNPRFCTQYNNSETGENIGPLLSGTAPWFFLALQEGLGIDLQRDSLSLNPLLREEDRDISFSLKHRGKIIQVRLYKPEGFFRLGEHSLELTVNGELHSGNTIPLGNTGSPPEIQGVFQS